MVCDECGKRCFYNYKNIKPPIKCFKHKKPNMVRTKDKTCENEKCTTRASYGYDKLKYCAKHKIDDMNNLVKKKCKFCNTTATYGLNKPEYCAKHKDANMTDLCNPICEYKDCRTLANFGYDKATHCSKHKANQMENIKHKKCEYNKCQKMGVYGIDKIKYCRDHKEPKMKNLFSKMCQYQDCDVEATFGIDKRTHCVIHKENQMKNLKFNKCVKCQLISGNRKYKNYCHNCYCAEFPNEKKVKYYKVKEKKVCEFINMCFSAHEPIFDKICGISKRRPDILFNFQKYCIIVEIDERQHCKYKDEIERVNEIKNDLKLPIIFIRFNPDSYLLENLKIKSSFNSKCEIRNIDEWNCRLEKLKNTIQHYIENPVSKTDEIKLFYNEI